MPTNSVKGFKVGNEVKKYDYNELDNLPENDPDDLAEEVNDLKSDLKQISIGKENFGFYANFDHYGLNTDGTFILTQQYRVSCEEHITITKPLTVTAKSGFRWGYIPFENGSAGSWKGWKTGEFTIPSGTEFVVQIARVTEVTTEVADVSEFVSALTFDAEMSEHVQNNTNALANVLSIIKSGEMQGATWEQGVVTESGEYSQSYSIRTQYVDVSPFRQINFSCEDGYKYYYITYDENKVFLSAISATSATRSLVTTGTNIKFIRVVLRKGDNSDLTPTHGENMHFAGINTVSEIPALSNRLNVVENIFRFSPFFSHIGVGKTSNVVIPSQSVDDVQRTKRLGFKALEINVAKTSDSKYVCIHGTAGKFGGAFIGANGTDVSATSISSVTLDWIKTNVRFVSKYPKYQTPPLSLEEMLLECKKNGIVPVVQYVDNAMVSILNQIMGLDNYILNVYGNNRDGKTDAVLISWTAIADIAQAVEKCESSGKNYILAVEQTNSVFSEFTNDDWKDYVEAIHAAGYYIGSAYTGTKTWEFIANGFDVIASSGQINDIESGNICNLDSGSTFEDFTVTNGTVSDGTLTLSRYGTIAPTAQIQSVFLGGASMHLRFNGTVWINMGVETAKIESDGTTDIWLSSFFEESAPTFSIEAAENTEFYSIMFKASKM